MYVYVRAKESILFSANQARTCDKLHALLTKIMATPDMKREKKVKSEVCTGDIAASVLNLQS